MQWGRMKVGVRLDLLRSCYYTMWMRLTIRVSLFIVSFLSGFSGVGAWAADEKGTSVELKTAEFQPAPALRDYVNMRVGASQNLGNGHADICLEVSPLSFFTLESCGTGSGFLHKDPVPELAHFRVNAVLADWKKGDYWFRPRVGAGFAELQVGQDSPGFSFSGPDAKRMATAGPEVSGSLSIETPIGGGFEAIGNLHGGAAMLAYAPRLSTPASKWQPFAGASLGIGF